MADQGPQHELAKAVIPFEADTKEIDREIDRLEGRIEGLGETFGKVLDPFIAKLDEVSSRLEEERDEATNLIPAGEAKVGEQGQRVEPLGPQAVASDQIKLTIAIEDLNQNIRDLNTLIPQLIAAWGAE